MTATATVTRTPTSSPAARPPLPNTAPSLAQAARGEGLIRRGQSGESVRELQELLRARGHDVTADGRFGPETERAVRAFQAASGAKVDGLVGPETMGKLQGRAQSTDALDRSATPRPANLQAPSETDRRAAPPPGTVRAGDLARTDDARRAREANGTAVPPGAPGAVTLAPEGATERERYDHYARIVRENGGEVCPDGRPTVLGIRGLSRDGEVHDTGSTRRYDDTFVVLTADGRVQELRGATHPGQRSSTQSPDVTGDGQGDVGMIRPGTFDVVPNGQHGGNASYHVRTTGGSGRLSGWRDTNQDGRFSDTERAASERRGDTLTGVLFHQGGDNAPRSIGCQTLSPADYDRFVETLGGPRTRFSYTLVDAQVR